MYRIRGACFRAEIIPFEPDPGNAGVGKKYPLFTNKLINQMRILVNDVVIDVPLGTNLHNMLLSRNIHDTNGIAIAVNENIIPKNEWDKYILQENDNVLLIRATQGG